MSNHDTPRAASRYGDTEDDANARLAMALLLTLRGTPFMYYGEEIGMRDLTLKRSEILDPPGKIYWPLYKGRDGCRGPMQWNGSEYSGFSSSQPWLPVHPDFPFRNVELQKNDPNSLFNFTRQLIQIRKENSALHSGSYSQLDTGSKKIMAFIRESSDQTILVALNFSSKKVTMRIGQDLANRQWIPLFPSDHPATFDEGYLDLSPHEIELLLMKT